MADTGWEHPDAVEWSRKIVEGFGLELHVVKSSTKTFLSMVRDRGMFPGPSQRQCTSDLKRDPIAKFIRNTVKESFVVSAMGLRAEESPARAKKEVATWNKRLSLVNRTVVDWLPIQDWTETMVRDHLSAREIPLHPVYEYLNRFSCRVCIFQTDADLKAVYENDREAFEIIANLEEEIGFTMRSGKSLRDVVGQSELVELECTVELDDAPEEETEAPLVVSFGGGVDSTAMLVEMKNRGIRPDLILFADTGAEKPTTYDHVRGFDSWLESVGFPTVTWVKYVPKIAKYRDLEGNCVDNETLPSLAFGMKSCSLKWKVDPQHRFLNNWAPAVEAWAEGDKVRRAIGYDNSGADKKRASKVTMAVGLDASGADKKRANSFAGAGQESEKYDYWYPLQDWNLDREKCKAVIEAEGLTAPPKSSCFFCPAMKKPELIELSQEHPSCSDERSRWKIATSPESITPAGSPKAKRRRPSDWVEGSPGGPSPRRTASRSPRTLSSLLSRQSASLPPNRSTTLSTFWSTARYAIASPRRSRSATGLDSRRFAPGRRGPSGARS